MTFYDKQIYNVGGTSWSWTQCGNLWLGNQEWLCLLEVKILEGEVCFHDTSSFDSGSQHILLGGNVSPAGYPVQVIQVTVGEVTPQEEVRMNTASHYFLHLLVSPTHYAAESLSWYSRERLKQA